jgi:hypothetical protein
MIFCKICQKTFNSKKGLSNHLRYGCPRTRKDEIKKRKIMEYRKISNKCHKKYPEKANARAIVYYHLKKGHIKKPKKCSINNKNCSGRIEAHHEDYSKPLKIEWLCKYHHKKKDKKNV